MPRTAKPTKAKRRKLDRCEVCLTPESRAALAAIRASLPGVSEGGAVRYALIRVSRELSGGVPGAPRAEVRW